MVLLQEEDRVRDAFWRGWAAGFLCMFLFQVVGLVAVLILR